MNEIAAAIGMFVIAAVRLAAIVWPLELPVYQLGGGEPPDPGRQRSTD